MKATTKAKIKQKTKIAVEKVSTENILETNVQKPLEIVEKPKYTISDDYDFATEVQKDWKNEKRLLFGEFAVICGIIMFAIIREILIRLVTQN